MARLIPGASHIERSDEGQFAQGLREPERYADKTGSAHLSRSGCAVVSNCGSELFRCLFVRACISWKTADQRAIALRSRLARPSPRSMFWNMRRRHSSHSWLTSAARTTVKGALFLRVHRSEAQTLNGRRSEGHRRSASQSRFRTVLCFQYA